jgi:hypothetical protein
MRSCACPTGGHRTLFAVATGDDALRMRVLEAGDRVVLDGPARRAAPDALRRSRPLAARDRPLNRTQVLALASAARHVHSPTGCATSCCAARSVAPTTRALLAGFLLGDTRAVPDDVVAAYRGSGLSHSARGVG